MQMLLTSRTYSFLHFLQALRLDNNRLEELNGLLNTQHHLQWLNVSHNLLQWFDYAFIPKSLLWLNLRNNRIEELGNYYDMQAGFRLVHLDVGGNRLQRVDRECLVHSLKEVSLITVLSCSKRGPQQSVFPREKAAPQLVGLSVTVRTNSARAVDTCVINIHNFLRLSASQPSRRVMRHSERRGKPVTSLRGMNASPT